MGIRRARAASTCLFAVAVLVPGIAVPSRDASAAPIPGGEHAMELRRDMGLATGPVAVRRAVTATEARVAAGDTRWYGTPMTDRELEEFERWQGLVDAATALESRIAGDLRDAALGFEIDRRIAHPKIRVGLVGDDATTRATVVAALPPAATVEFVARSMSRRQRDELLESVRLAVGTGGPATEPLSRLGTEVTAHLGPVVNVYATGLDERVTVVADVSQRNESPSSDLVAVADPRVRVEVARTTPATNRHSSPGPLKSGLGIFSVDWGRSCSSNVSVASSTGARYLLTAAHCFQDQAGAVGYGRVFEHDGVRIGTSHLYQHSPPYDDWGLIFLDVRRMASEYVLAQPNENPNLWSVEPMLANASGFVAANSLSCFDGATSQRPYWTECGYHVHDGGAATGYDVAIPLCLGDSGGLLRYGGTPQGIFSGYYGSPPGVECGTAARFTSISRALSEASAMGSASYTVVGRSPYSPSVPASSIKLRVLSSGKCLHASGGSFGSAVSTVQYSCSTSYDDRQLWAMMPIYDGTGDLYRLVRNSGANLYCLARSGTTTVDQRPCATSVAHQWNASDWPGSHNVSFQAKATTQCLDYEAGDAQNNRATRAYGCTLVSRQIWVPS